MHLSPRPRLMIRQRTLGGAVQPPDDHDSLAVTFSVPGQPFPLRQTSASSPSPATDNEEAIANPDLRMAFDTFKKRRAENSIVVVDVRSEDEFLAGHVPGATWIPSNRLTEHIAELRARGKPVVTYCS